MLTMTHMSVTTSTPATAWRCSGAGSGCRLLLTVPIVLYSDMVQDWFGYTAPSFPGSSWVAPVLGTVVFLYGGGRS